ncbi:MAG: polyprenyl synthetase family protein [Bacteroidia bacterium]|nr:polyprenyl synthetase family protein [Bacteroidia bacterium]MBP7261220.1 polyprenyl synthetase family protein [Bacteroidia bacterium]MBP9181002.1 polyprenyl synthetase family protein [Bacteroidia bacterium]MBP9724907.1 polyprenyl synthetase family protein [Bacteroidia bacterium]
MDKTIDLIKKPVAAELDAFELKFRDAMKSNVALLDTIMTYIVKRKGKQIRPMFVFLTAKLCGGINESTHRGASLVELLHTATLVHDDVVDDAYERRGFFSINALWKNKIAVLVGDYLLSKGLLLSLNNDDFKLLKIVSEAVREMSEGELLQIEKTRRLNITEEVYYDIIRKKTASLIASCCAVGAASANSSNEVVEKMHLFGEKIGIAFQIKDDLLDYGDDEIGKPKGIDIKEKKLTLPIIYTLNTAEPAVRKHIINTIKKDHNNKQKVNELIAYVNTHGGIGYAKAAMEKLIQEALEILDTFEDNDAKSSLRELVKYIVQRSH